MTKITLIWAQTNDGTIALNRQIPWHEKDDLKIFKALTLEKVVVMGRHTMESFNGRPLPERMNLVLTHDESLEVPMGFQKVYSIESALTIAEESGTDLAIIGGKPVYEAFMDLASDLYVTYLDTDFTGDVKMPVVDKTEWQGTEYAHGVTNEENDYDYSVMHYTCR